MNGTDEDKHRRTASAHKGESNLELQLITKIRLFAWKYFEIRFILLVFFFVLIDMQKHLRSFLGEREVSLEKPDNNLNIFENSVVKERCHTPTHCHWHVDGIEEDGI